MCFNAYANPTAQVVMTALSALELDEAFQHFVDCFLRYRDEDFLNFFNKLYSSPIGSRLLETVLTTAPQEIFDVFFSCFSGRMNKIAIDSNGNFVVSKLLQSPKLTQKNLKTILKELKFRSVLESGTKGVIWRTAEACARVRCCFHEFMKKLNRCFGINDTSDNDGYIWLTFLKNFGSTKIGLDDSKIDFDPIGCSTLTTLLLSFPVKYNQILTDNFDEFLNILKKNEEFRIKMAISKSGCRVIEAILDIKSPISDEKQQSFIGLYIKSLCTLSFNYLGSFCVGAMYQAANIETKRLMLDEMSDISDKLKTSNFVLYQKCRMGTYNKRNWDDNEAKHSKARKLIGDVFIKAAE
eukprot:GHVL01029270.1.p1 GENE.GHVL01029270.1~~GHVL01029270.1.p1  ORF type:complete len:353 (+),score=80.86 GHVL01029270.1:779-1837(+)